MFSRSRLDVPVVFLVFASAACGRVGYTSRDARPADSTLADTSVLVSDGSVASPDMSTALDATTSFSDRASIDGGASPDVAGLDSARLDSTLVPPDAPRSDSAILDVATLDSVQPADVTTIVDTATQPDSGGFVCGNGRIDPGELCDRAAVVPETCITRGFASGQLRCSADCSAYDTTNCGPATCGDNNTDPGEACDGTDLNGYTCVYVATGFRNGTLRCLSDCSGYDTSSCNPGNHVAAASCSHADVTDALSRASDGDTVDVPAGSCTWDSTLNLDKRVALIGAGVGQTIITDGTRATSELLIWATGDPVRISRFSFRSTNGQYGIQIENGDNGWRVDHCDFTVASGSAIHLDDSEFGVIDHVRFTFQSTGDALESFGHGPTPWATPIAFGTTRATYVEDCEFIAPAIILNPSVSIRDGARVVVRYSRHEGTVVFSNPLDRNFRAAGSVEVYQNLFHRPQVATMYLTVYIGGGTALLFDNVVTGNYTAFTLVNEYRTCDQYTGSPSRCDGRPTINGSSLNDGNQPVANGSGMHDGSNNSPTLTDANQTWTASSLVDRWLYNLRANAQCRITANTITTATCTLSGGALWRTGDGYKITDGYPCVDQPGYGPDVDRDGVQDASPIYEWSNTLSGGNALVQVHDPWACTSPSLADHIRNGRDYMNDTPAPGYRSFVYPHPLVRIAP